MNALLHNPLFWFALYYVFSSVVSGMPAPDAKSGQGYRWAYATLHALAGNLFNVLKSTGKLPNGDTMKTLSILLLVLALPLAVCAQTPTPTPAPSPTPDCSSAAIAAGTAESNCGVHFITGSAFYQLSNGKQATEFDARLPLTPRWSGFAAVFAIPGAQGNVTVAGPEFRERLSHLLGKQSIKTNQSLNLSKVEVFGRGGLGSEVNSVNNQRSFAYSVEGGLEFPIATVAGGPVVKTGIRVGYLGVLHYGAAPEKYFLGSNTTISPQVTISF